MHTTARTISVWVIGAFFIAAGAYHLIHPRPYLAMIPTYLPAPAVLVAVSGVAEILGGVGVLLSVTRVVAGWGLIALLLAVFPANLHVALHGWPGVDLLPWILWVRLLFQPLFIWLVHRFCIAKFPAQ